MRVEGQSYRTVWMDGSKVFMIDQNRLPFEFSIRACASHIETAEAIRNMTIRGAPAIGVAAGFALAQAFLGGGANPWDAVREARAFIEATRPTARDLFFATDRVWRAAEREPGDPGSAALREANALAEASVEGCRRIGVHGQALITDGARVLTHCNAGWLACVDHGTATAPMYQAAAVGKRLHVWVDETRPRSQGARLTAWELGNERISHRVVPDNAAAHLMSRGEVDLVLVGADRITRAGDVINKIGTLEKAICAREFGVPFYVAAPLSTFDWLTASASEVTIEERSDEEVNYQSGPDTHGVVRRIRVTAPGSSAYNPAFDVTPARFITGLITERGLERPGELVGPMDPLTA